MRVRVHVYAHMTHAIGPDLAYLRGKTNTISKVKLADVFANPENPRTNLTIT